MAIKYYTRVFNAAAGTLARANDVKDDFDAIETAFDTISLDTERSMKLPSGEATDHLVNLTPAQRKNTFLGFDGSGVLTVFTNAASASELPVADSAGNMLRVNATADAWETMTPAVARTNLGLQAPATAVFGNSSGTVAEGNHNHSTVPLDASVITTGVLTRARGALGVATSTDRGVLVGRGAGNIEATAAGAAGIPLIGAGASNPVFGTAIVGGGGTGRTTLTDRATLIGRGTGAIDQVGPGTSGQVLTSTGASTNPSYQTPADARPAAATDYTAGGWTYLYEGNTAKGQFAAVSSITESTWESVGPTGSGADNVYTAMDDIPASATAAIFVNTICLAQADSAGVECEIRGYVRPNGTSWAMNGASLVVTALNELAASGEQINTPQGDFVIALDGDLTFDCSWAAFNDQVRSWTYRMHGYIDA